MQWLTTEWFLFCFWHFARFNGKLSHFGHMPSKTSKFSVPSLCSKRVNQRTVSSVVKVFWLQVLIFKCDILFRYFGRLNPYNQHSHIFQQPDSKRRNQQFVSNQTTKLAIYVKHCHQVTVWSCSGYQCELTFQFFLAVQKVVWMTQPRMSASFSPTLLASKTDLDFNSLSTTKISSDTYSKSKWFT